MNSSTVVVYKDNSLEKIRVFFDTIRLCIHENIIFLIASFAPDHRVLFQHVLKQLPPELKYICLNQSQDKVELKPPSFIKGRGKARLKWGTVLITTNSNVKFQN